MHASQCRRLRLFTGSPHIVHASGFAGLASIVPARHFRLAYGRGCETLRGDGHPIRRAQALAVTNGLDLAIARELIAAKLNGQRRILLRLGADLRELDKVRAAIDGPESIERVRVIEATAAGLYFSAWLNVRIHFRDRDADRIPARWLRADSRASLLTGAPRAATSPINSMRNYLFACVESEARLALLAHGCDPAIGVVHADQRNRDSLALDAMEPVRADVDAFLLDMLEDRVFTARDFGELPNGICRIAAPLTHELALTLPHWRECLRPIAARLAQAFREAHVNPCALASQTAAGNDPRRNAAVNRARGEAVSEGHRRNRSWAREHPDQRDEAWFTREIAPKLDAFTLSEIAAVTGLSLAACSRTRAGARVPHPRHWEALQKLADS